MFSKAFKKVVKGQEISLSQHLLKYQLKSPVAWGAVAGVGIASSAWAMKNGSNRNSLGTIVSHEGTLSNMVSSQMSPVLQSYQQGKTKMTNTVADKVARGNLVDGDLAFALHNMR